MAVREHALKAVEASWFQTTVISLILANAFVLGFETSSRLMERHGTLLEALDRTILTLFVCELGLRLFAHRGKFFRDPWNWFDLVIVGIALLPAAGPFAVLRVMRVLRVLRLLSVIPSLRHVVAGLFRALPGMASIMVLVVILLYVSAVMATKLFGEHTPRYFGDLGTSLFTLFQIFTADGWANIANDVMEHQSYAWIFFVVFVLVSTLVALNLFIAVAVEALDNAGGDGSGSGGSKASEEESGDRTQEQILTELRALRAEVETLRHERTSVEG